MFSAKVNWSLNHQEPGQEDPRDDESLGLSGLNRLKRMEQQDKEGQKSQLRSIDRIISERAQTPSENDWEDGNQLRNPSRLKNLFGKMQKAENEVEFEIPEEEEE